MLAIYDTIDEYLFVKTRINQLPLPFDTMHAHLSVV